jgi:hypothetical protein
MDHKKDYIMQMLAIFYYTVMIRYPDKFGYRVSILAYNRIFNIQTTKFDNWTYLCSVME